MARAPALRPLLSRLHTLLRAKGGNVALMFALALPPLAVGAVGAIQIGYVMNVRHSAQDVADSAALAGAQQLSVGGSGATSRAQAWAAAQLQNASGSSTFTVSASQPDNHSITVAIDTYTPSFFGDLLPKGGFRAHVSATAQQQAQAPLCVLVDGARGDQLHVQDSSQLTGSCLVHGNGDIVTDPQAAITASRVESVGNANGPIAPTPAMGAAPVADPFTNLNFAPPQPCTPSHAPLPGLLTVLPNIVHQEDITIPNNTPLVLTSGTYYFCGKLSIGNGASITGTNVLLVFDVNATIDAKPNANIQISGLQSGALAGFVLAVNGTSSNYKLPVDPFNKITGAIYAPGTTLELNGSKKGAGSASDWTVVAAKALKVTGGANLQINTNYAGSQVQVPIGVGDKAASGGAIRLTS